MQFSGREAWWRFQSRFLTELHSSQIWDKQNAQRIGLCLSARDPGKTECWQSHWMLIDKLDDEVMTQLDEFGLHFWIYPQCVFWPLFPFRIFLGFGKALELGALPDAGKLRAWRRKAGNFDFFGLSLTVNLFECPFLVCIYNCLPKFDFWQEKEVSTVFPSVTWLLLDALKRWTEAPLAEGPATQARHGNQNRKLEDQEAVSNTKHGMFLLRSHKICRICPRFLMRTENLR